MANSISARSSIIVQFNIDTNAGNATVSLLCNRQYLVVDAAVTAGANAIDGFINNTTAAGVTTIVSTINNIGAGAIARPTLVGAPTNTMNLDTANSTVARGSTLSVVMTNANDFSSGYILVLPGNRYSAVTSSTAYYANNTASGNNNGTVSI